MKTFFILIFCIVSAEFAFSQTPPPEILWQRSYGGALSDVIYSIALSKDGGAVLAGYTASGEDTTGKVITCGADVDMMILKINSNGRILSTRVIDGINQDMANCIIPSQDGNSIIAATSNSTGEEFEENHGDDDIVLLKLTDKGSIAWQHCYGGSRYDDAGAVIENKDGSLVAAGESYSSNGDLTCNNGNSDLWIFKTNDTGKIVWQHNYGGSNYEKANAIVKCANGDYLIAGHSDSKDGDVIGNHGGDDGWVIRTDSNGCLKWQHCYGGSNDDVFNDLKPQDGGSFILCGYTYSNDQDVSGNHGDADMWVVKIDSTGNIVWQKTFGGSSSEFALSLDISQHNGILVGGFSRSTDGNCRSNFGQRDMWLLSLDESGNLLWQKNLGGSDNDVCYAVREANNGSIFAAGYSKSKDGEINGNHGREDFCVFKLSAAGLSDKTKAGIPELMPSYTRDYFPLDIKDNAVNGNMMMMSVYDSFGRKVLLKPVSGSSQVDASSWQPGLYTIVLRGGNQLASKKVIRLD